MRRDYREYLKTGLLLAGIVFFWTMLSVYCRKVQMQKDISEAVIRFHVIANSDSEEDQKIKYKVRDGVLESVQAAMEEAENKEEAEQVLASQLDVITDAANEILAGEGVSYRAKAVMEETQFPEKTYGDLTFPAGTYEAVRLLLGTGEGKNWWCVMFPTLCLVDGTCEKVPKKARQKLKESLTREEYHSLIKKENGINYEYRFRLEELFLKIFS